MKTPFQGQTITTTTENEEEEVVGANFDAKSLKYVLDALTDMYPNLDLAVLREYSTNALDSHKAAGVTRPIEVTLPSEHDLHLRIQDFGLGMDKAALRKYVSYGYSTKRDTNNQLGEKGLGSKSALAAIDSFRVISVKDGMRHIAIVDKDAEGVGQIRFKSSKPTEESNGVIVIIPAAESSIESYAEQAAYAYQLWEDGTVLVNGRKPAHVEDRGYQRAGDKGYLAHNSRSYRSDIRVNMGGLLYKVDGLDYTKRQELFKNAPALSTKDFIVNVQVGDVKVAPSRESIVSNAQSLRVVAKAIQDLYNYLMKHAQDEINAAPNAFDAMKVIDTFNFLDIAKFTYEGNEFTSTFDGKSLETYRWQTEQGRRKKTSSIGESLNLPVSHKASAALVIDTHKSAAFHHQIVSTLNTVRKMHADFAVNRNFIVGDFTEATKDNIFIDAMVENGLYKVLPADKLMEDVAAYRKANRPRGNAGGSRGAITYPVFVHGGKDQYGDNITETEYLTIAELRELDGPVYIHQPVASGFDERHSARVFRTYGVEGEHMIFVTPQRSVETLERRIGKHVETKLLSGDFSNRIRAKLVTPEVSRIHSVYDGYNRDNAKKFFRGIMETGIEIKSPIFKEAADYDPEAVSLVIRDNGDLYTDLRSVGSTLTEDDRAKFLSRGDGDNGSAYQNFWGTYKIALDMVSTWNPGKRELKYAAFLINQIFETEGDPTL